MFLLPPIWLLSAKLLLLTAIPASLLYLEPFLLPNTPFKTLRSGSRHEVCIQLSPLPPEQIVQHFLKLSQQPGWQLTFPTALEAERWLQALQKSAEPPVLMLGLSRGSLNTLITIGVVKTTREARKKTIITLDLAPTAFGRLRR